MGVALLAVGVVAIAGGYGVWRLFQAPAVEPTRLAPDDGVRAQQKMFDLARHRPRAATVVFSEAVGDFRKGTSPIQFMVRM